MTATEAVQDAKALVVWFETMYDACLPFITASRYVEQYAKKKQRLDEYNLRLSLKWQLIDVCFGLPSERPKANPNRVTYPLDEYARVPPITMYSILIGQTEAGPWMELAIRRYEDMGGHVGETQRLLDLERGLW